MEFLPFGHGLGEKPHGNQPFHGIPNATKPWLGVGFQLARNHSLQRYLTPTEILDLTCAALGLVAILVVNQTSSSESFFGQPRSVPPQEALCLSPRLAPIRSKRVVEKRVLALRGGEVGGAERHGAAECRGLPALAVSDARVEASLVQR